MINVIFGSIVSFITVVNLAYAASLAYKESITNGQCKRTSNGVLLVMFRWSAELGLLAYGIIKILSNLGNSKKDEKTNRIVAGVLSCLSTFGLAALTHKIYEITAVTPDEDPNIFQVLVSSVFNAMISVYYYGFIFGLFGGDNCRLQDSVIGRVSSVIGDLASKFDNEFYVEGLKEVKEVVEDEVNATKGQDRRIVLNPLKYLLAVAAKVVSTLAEEIRGASSILVDVKNGFGFVVMWLLLFVMRGINEFASGVSNVVTEEEVEAIIENPFSIALDSLRATVITFIVIGVIRIIIRLIMLILPAKVSNVWYEKNRIVHDESLKRLNTMSKRNLEKDSYARKYSIKKHFDKAAG